MKHQPKWRAKTVGSSTTDLWVSSSDRTTDEEVSHPMGQDRTKAVVRKGKRKGKGKEGSSNQSESSYVVCGMMSTLKRLNASFAKTQLCK
jgi:hypothetical protein